MNAMNVSVSDIIGISRNDVARWFLVDDTNLSTIFRIADAAHCEFHISYDIPRENESSEMANIVID